jgi:two-component system sensor histidine kinase KdpD
MREALAIFGFWRTPGQLRSGLRYVAAVGMALAITGVLLLVDVALAPATVAMVYLLGVLVIATAAGIGPGALTSGLCFVCFNFFFVEPRYTLHVESQQNVVHLATFLAVAVIASSLAARARAAAGQAQRQATELNALYQLSQAISAEVDLEQILPAIAATTRELLGVPLCAILVANQAGQLAERAQAGQPAPSHKLIQVPIRDGASVLGILRVAEPAPGAGLSAAQLQLLQTLAAQTRLAIDRARLVEQTAHNQALGESDRLKSALLAAVSHDLRTPLAIVKGAATTLLAEGVSWDASTQRALAQTIDGEIDHLNQVVGNLLDMSRIDAGSLPAERDWHDLAELIGSALGRIEPRMAGRGLRLDLAPDLPLVYVNPVLIGQVLVNLLENALRHTPPGTPIEVAARGEDGPGGQRAVLVRVSDAGPGIPAGELPQIFEKFYRGAGSGGAGLGLAICRGLVEAHGGRIWAENRPEGGASFAFTLPLASA